MKQRKWYYTDPVTGKNIDIEGDPHFHQISDVYDNSCAHEEDADLDCPACVIYHLQNLILEKDRCIKELEN